MRTPRSSLLASLAVFNVLAGVGCAAGESDGSSPRAAGAAEPPGAGVDDGGGVGTFGGPTTSSAGDAGGPCAPNFTGRLRDFVNKPGFTPASALDPDFEIAKNDDHGIVETDLGADRKPVYANPNGTTSSTHGKALFDLWYRDSPGINIPFDYALAPTPSGAGVQTFDDQEFFPLDGKGWNDEYTGDDGKLHNFSFTFELHTTFAYAGGETFTFSGDDDVFVFIHDKLVVDLGGIHSAETKSIELDRLTTDDARKAPVPLFVGTTYPLDIFYNERHTVSSHFRMDTSIAFNNCAPIIVK